MRCPWLSKGIEEEAKLEQHFHGSQTGSFAGEVGHEVMVGGQRHRERRVLVDDAAALGLVLPSQHAVRLRGAAEEQQVASACAGRRRGQRSATDSKRGGVAAQGLTARDVSEVGQLLHGLGATARHSEASFVRTRHADLAIEIHVRLL